MARPADTGAHYEADKADKCSRPVLRDVGRRLDLGDAGAALGPRPWLRPAAGLSWPPQV